MVRPETKQISISMKPEVYDTIQAAYEESKEYSRAKTASGWMLETILYQIMKEKEFLKEHFPNLSKKAVDGNSLIIRDSEINSLVEVTYRKGKLWCDTDEKFDCPHIHFALTLPELSKLKSHN